MNKTNDEPSINWHKIPKNHFEEFMQFMLDELQLLQHPKFTTTEGSKRVSKLKSRLIGFLIGK
jgi:hypothetical protein